MKCCSWVEKMDKFCCSWHPHLSPNLHRQILLPEAGVSSTTRNLDAVQPLRFPKSLWSAQLLQETQTMPTRADADRPECLLPALHTMLCCTWPARAAFQHCPSLDWWFWTAADSRPAFLESVGSLVCQDLQIIFFTPRFQTNNIMEEFKAKQQDEKALKKTLGRLVTREMLNTSLKLKSFKTQNFKNWWSYTPKDKQESCHFFVTLKPLMP